MRSRLSFLGLTSAALSRVSTRRTPSRLRGPVGVVDALIEVSKAPGQAIRMNDVAEKVSSPAAGSPAGRATRERGAGRATAGLRRRPRPRRRHDDERPEGIRCDGALARRSIRRHFSNHLDETQTAVIPQRSSDRRLRNSDARTRRLTWRSSEPARGHTSSRLPRSKRADLAARLSRLRHVAKI